jgi:hypothetical protein
METHHCSNLKLTIEKLRCAQPGWRLSGGQMLPVEVVWSTAQKPTSDTGRDGVLVVDGAASSSVGAAVCGDGKSAGISAG